jgi:hypothetical protein
MKIAIKGDKVRFKEVNAILQFLTGKKVRQKGSVEELYYCMDAYKCVFCNTRWAVNVWGYTTYTIDQFYQKYNLTYSDIINKINGRIIGTN